MKRALVLSGGGSKGSYTVGVLKYFIGELQRQYDILCGVSVGALIASQLSMFKIGEEKEACEHLLNLWENLTTDKIWKRWFPFGRLHGLWKSSLYNSSPLQKLVRSRLDLDRVRSSGKEIRVGAVSLTNGNYKLFSQNDDSFVEGVLASSSYPGMLCPIKIDGELWSDGGIKEITPLKSAINLGADEVDVIITSPENAKKDFPNDPGSIAVILRSIDLMSDEIISNDIDKAIMYNTMALSGVTCNKRFVKINIIRPNHILLNDSLDFSNEKMKNLIQIGYEDAKNNINIK